MMDRVERRVTKRNEIAKVNRMYEETAHEFATLGDYRRAMINAYRKTKREQLENGESTSKEE